MAASGDSLFLPRALIKTFMEIWHDDVVKFRTCRSLSILGKNENPEFEPKVCEINVVLNF